MAMSNKAGVARPTGYSGGHVTEWGLISLWGHKNGIIVERLCDSGQGLELPLHYVMPSPQQPCELRLSSNCQIQMCRSGLLNSTLAHNSSNNKFQTYNCLLGHWKSSPPCPMAPPDPYHLEGGSYWHLLTVCPMPSHFLLSFMHFIMKKMHLQSTENPI